MIPLRAALLAAVVRAIGNLLTGGIRGDPKVGVAGVRLALGLRVQCAGNPFALGLIKRKPGRRMLVPFETHPRVGALERVALRVVIVVPLAVLRIIASVRAVTTVGEGTAGSERDVHHELSAVLHAAAGAVEELGSWFITMMCALSCAEMEN